MDMNKYKQEFISEARDHLDTLNDCLLVLEKDSADLENINKTFRAFHTLKGNAATMGFIKFSELAHSLEDVLAKVRDGALKVTHDIMDLIFQGVDRLENGLEAISKGEAESIDAEDLIKEIHEAMGFKEETITVNIDEVAKLSPEQKAKSEELKAGGMNLQRLIILFDAKNVLKTAKAMLVVRNLSEDSEIIRTTPSSDEIKAGKFNTEIEIILATKQSKDELNAVMNRVAGLGQIIFLGIDEAYKKPAESAHAEKEIAKAAIVDKHQAEVVKQVQSVKVDMARLDKLMNLVGELLISNIRLQDIDRRRDIDSLRSVLAGVDRLILDLQDEVMQVRMIPIGNIFQRFPRMVRDLAGKEGKKVNFIVEGQDIEFDRTILDQIGDPLVHLLRNAVDHGIETPEERVNKGKAEEGTIRMIAKREKNNAVIQVIDDGDGIDPNKVKAAALRKGKITQKEADSMTDSELQMLIFRAGMSTNEVVTEVSGRGVGMDVVGTSMKELGGVVKLQSIVGKGTTVSMQLPLTIAIVSALLVRVKEDIFAVPLNSIDQTVDITSDQIKTVHGHEVFILRSKEIPLLWMHDLMGKANEKNKDKYTVVIVSRESGMIGLVVDSILSQQQILIKGLQDMVKGTKGVAGATILGDGSVALIIDIGTLI